MRRILIAILALLYLSSTVGATIYFHFCMGNLVGSSLVSLDDSKCSECGMVRNHSEDSSCCHEKSTQVRNDEDQNVFHASTVSPAKSIIIVYAGLAAIWFPLTLTCSHTHNNNDPPSSNQAIHVLNCVYRL